MRKVNFQAEISAWEQGERFGSECQANELSTPVSGMTN